MCRFGGEEFVLILLGATLTIALSRAEALRAEVSKLELEHEGKRVGTVTISLGISIFPDHGKDASSLLRTADKALY